MIFTIQLGLEMALLMLKNLFLSIVTLGIYRAWAKTNTRRYIWGNVSVMGDRGAYVGTGEELFKGWVKLIGLTIAVVLVGRVLTLIFKPAGLLVPIFYVCLFGLATYSGLRYRLSRTLWRQIRFGVDKDEKTTREFMKIYLLGMLFTVLSFGIYYPWFKNDVRGYLTRKSRFGSAYFSYDGVGSEYAGIYFWGILLSVLTLGIYLPWYALNGPYELSGPSVCHYSQGQGSIYFLFSRILWHDTHSWPGGPMDDQLGFKASLRQLAFAGPAGFQPGSGPRQ